MTKHADGEGVREKEWAVERGAGAAAQCAVCSVADGSCADRCGRMPRADGSRGALALGTVVTVRYVSPLPVSVVVVACARGGAFVLSACTARPSAHAAFGFAPSTPCPSLLRGGYPKRASPALRSLGQTDTMVLGADQPRLTSHLTGAPTVRGSVSWVGANRSHGQRLGQRQRVVKTAVAARARSGCAHRCKCRACTMSG
jgi:hypothetical protein